MIARYKNSCSIDTIIPYTSVIHSFRVHEYVLNFFYSIEDYIRTHSEQLNSKWRPKIKIQDIGRCKIFIENDCFRQLGYFAPPKLPKLIL